VCQRGGEDEECVLMMMMMMMTFLLQRHKEYLKMLLERRQALGECVFNDI